MGISKEKIQTVIENCFNAECNIATIHDAFERGFRAGMQEDVQPVVHGEWIPVDSYSAFGGDEATWMAHGNPIALHYCSECGKDAYAGEDGEELLTDFCPSCGADMRGKNNGKTT